MLPFFALIRLARREPRLARAPIGAARSVSVVIPARNEAETIETVVRSILQTTHPNTEILIVDDRSTDATAAIAERLAGLDARVRLVRGEELPAGWFGKPWACLQGYRAARGDVVVFTDADTTHAPELLSRALGALDERRAGLVTVMSKQLCLTFWERVVMPQIWCLLGFRFHPLVVNRARRASDVIANGQFIMVTREAYEAAGTHEAVKGEVAEDLALAQAFLRAKRRVYFAFGEEFMQTRMYRNLPHMIEGWSKNVYLGARRSFPENPVMRALVPMLLVAAALFWLVPPIALAATRLAPSLGPVVQAIGLGGTMLSAVFWMLVSVGMGIPVRYGLAYPLGASMLLYIVLRSTWRGASRVEWRGRTYQATEQP